MTEVSKIISDLMSVRATLHTEAQRLVAAVEAVDGLASPLARVPEGDVKALAEECARMDLLHVGVARKMDASLVAEAMDTREVARCIDHSDLAGNLCMSDIADAIDLSDLAQEVLDGVSTRSIAERVAERFTASDVAEEMSASDVAAEMDCSAVASYMSANQVAAEMDPEAVAARVWDAMYAEQKDRLAGDVVTAMLGKPQVLQALASALCAKPEFVNAVAQHVADAITGRLSDPEPHGTRDTFVPAPSEGPDGEAYNTLQS